MLAPIVRYAGRYGAKKLGLKILDSDVNKLINPRKNYDMQKYNNPSSAVYGNKKLLKEYYNPKLPIDKDVKKWNATDLINATNSPLYKHDTLLQKKAKEYIKIRSKHRFSGFK